MNDLVAAKKKPTSAWDAKRARELARGLAASRAGRDIAADYPKPRKRDLELRRSCERDLRRFIERFFPEAVPLAWSDDHLRVIATLQSAILHGGMFAVAMPRGSGKTTVCIIATMWALLYGHLQFVALIGATEKAATELLESIKTALLTNERLHRPFRSVTHAIRALEGNARKSIGQLFNGQRTYVKWTSDQVVFPTMPAEACDGANVSGAVVGVCGITGAIRGLRHTTVDGRVIRPDLVILDDPQTRESARSPSQCAERLSIIQGDILGLAGPGKKIAAVMPCTVIRSGDVADVLLDREINPAWQGVKTSMVYAWPNDEAMWKEYFKLRDESMREGRRGVEATEFYRRRRSAMDDGAVVAWPAKFNPDELSGVQHAMNLRADLGDEAFFAEYQNQPIEAGTEALEMLTARQVAEKVNGLEVGIVHVSATTITAMVDVHDSLLVWCVCAWAPGFTGWVLDYGTWPEQPSRAWRLGKLSRTLGQLKPGAGREGAIRAGLDALGARLLGRVWQREDGGTMQVERCLIDAGWVPEIVQEYCRHSPFAAILSSSRGYGIVPPKAPLDEWKLRPGERRGLGWILGRATDRTTRVVRFDANKFKSFVHARLAISLGDHGCLTLFKGDVQHHSTFAEHVTSEHATLITSQADGRTVAKWAMKPGVSDNHYFDALIGCAVGAAVQGIELEAVDVERKQPVKTLAQQKEERKIWKPNRK